MLTSTAKAKKELIEKKEELMKMIVQIKKRIRREQATIRYTIYSLAIIELENLFDFMTVKNEESIKVLKTSLQKEEKEMAEKLNQLDELITKNVVLRKEASIILKKEKITSEERQVLNDYKGTTQKLETKVERISKNMAKYILEKNIYYDKVKEEEKEAAKIIIPPTFKKIKEDAEFIPDIDFSEMFIEETERHKRHNAPRKNMAIVETESTEEQFKGINIPKTLIKQKNKTV